MTWRPSLRPDVDPYELPLDAEQGFLLSRLDGVTEVADLAHLTGLAPERLEDLLAGLVRFGAIDPPSGAAAREAPPEPEASTEASADQTEADAAEAEEDRETEARDATHRQLFETRLHGQEVDARVAQARQAEEPELSAYCFDPM